MPRKYIEPRERYIEVSNRHLDNGFGMPLCGAPTPGSVLVEQPVSITCQVCLVHLGDFLRRKAGQR